MATRITAGALKFPSIASGPAPARCGTASSPARCSRKTEFPRRASVRESPCPARCPRSGLGDGRIEDALRPELPLQSHGGLEYSALPFHAIQVSSRLQSATSSPNTMTRSSRAISSASVSEIISTMVFGSPENLAAFKLARSRIDVRRVLIHENDSLAGGAASSARSVASRTSRIDFGFHRFELLLVDNSFAHQEQPELGKRIAARLCSRSSASCRAFRRRKASANRDA